MNRLAAASTFRDQLGREWTFTVTPEWIQVAEQKLGVDLSGPGWSAQLAVWIRAKVREDQVGWVVPFQALLLDQCRERGVEFFDLVEILGGSMQHWVPAFCFEIERVTGHPRGPAPGLFAGGLG